MATFAADHRLRLIVAAAVLAVLVACIHSQPEAPPPAPVPVVVANPGPPPATPAPPAETERRPLPEAAASGPDVRVGLKVGAGPVTVGGADAFAVTEPDGALLAVLGAGEELLVTPAGTGLRLRLPGGREVGTESATITPDAGGLVRVDGKHYRGQLVLLPDRTGLTVVNTLGLEDYVAAVVASEMGRRGGEDLPALEAQAVISRTYALRNLGRWRSQGFDLYATVADQAYGGADAESPVTRQAVASTRGEIVTYGGAPIDAFFFSTCGGRTADGTEVFQAADRPYLRSVSDLDPDGEAYCRFSPRYRWSESWTGSELRAVMSRTLPAVTGVPQTEAGRVSDLRVLERTGSGRVGALAVRLPGREVVVPERQVRQVLRPRPDELLRSATFTLSIQRDGRGIGRVVADGRGAGHGVGFCQWGAVGRARAGQDYHEIIAAYYPGTTVQRRY